MSREKRMLQLLRQGMEMEMVFGMAFEHTHTVLMVGAWKLIKASLSLSLSLL